MTHNEKPEDYTTEPLVEETTVPDTQRLHDLSRALLVLAQWYAGPSGDDGPLERVETYLKGFSQGQRILEERYQGDISRSVIFD